jgi:chromosome segregation protein
MKIKRLEIAGFKSFVDKVFLDFQQGITGVVGPNGCGKSNIVDAIRWAMGEQNVRHLRGRAMEDIIFGGCETRKPHGMAQVSIIFDNSARSCPSAYKEFNEIMVTRCLYRNGDSEYRINKTPCRLLDITELFMDTGVGARAYSIIEQGKVGMLISAKPEERRVLIEEVAGVTKYKSRKKTALRKMDATRQNLVRLNDLIVEVRRQMGSLKRQAQRAEKFRELRAELKSIELALSGSRYQKLQVEAELVAAKERGQGDELLRRDNRLAEDELQLEERQLQLILLEREHRDAQEGVFQLGSEVQRVENGLQLNVRQREHLSEQEQQLEAELDSSATQLRLLEEEFVELRDRDSSSVLELKRLQRLVAEGDGLLREKQIQEQQRRGRLEDCRTAQMAMAALRSRLLNRSEDIERQLTHQGERRLLLKTDTDALWTQREQLAGRVENLERQLGQLHLERQQLGERIAGCEEQQLCLQRDQERRQRELTSARQRLELQRSRYESLCELQDGLEGYAEGTRLLLKKLAGQRIFADLIRVPQEYESAVEIALGERLQAVPAQLADVADILVHLTEKRARGHLLLPGPRQNPAASGIGRALLGLVNVEPGSEELAAQLLGGVSLVEDCCACLDAPLELGQMLVDRLGNSLDWHGHFSGGAATQGGGGLLRRQRQLEELELELVELEKRWQFWAGEVEAVREQLHTLDESRRVADGEDHRLELQLLEATKDRQGLESEREQLEKRLELLVFDLEQIKENSVALTREREQALVEIAEAGVGGQRLEEQGVCLRDEVDELHEDLELFREELTQQRLRLATIEQQQKAQMETLRRIETQRENLLQRRELLQQRHLSGREELARLAVDDEHLKVELNLLFQRREAQQQTVDKLRSGYDKQRLMLDEFREQSQLLRRDAEALRKQVAALQLHQRELRSDAEHVRQGILERYLVDLAEYQMSEAIVEDAELQQRTLKKLQQQVVALGDVNLMAIDEYGEREQRYDFLSQQRDDLSHALDDLQKANGQINRTTRKRFKETFELVNEKFRQVFPRLFRGGQAELCLTDEDDLLETGIEIIVQPPGKRLQNVNLLSGGEKALTAVALIFSLFLIKPTPFCILDEIDAPLDDANIDRFADMVKEMTDQSQFIIITHSKRTMSVVDTMYGVTMQEPGISKIVSVRMNEAVA